MSNGRRKQQLDLFADRTSAHTLRANQLRLWFSTPAYTLISAMRRKVLKLGAQLRISVRRFFIHFAGACPYQDVFRQAWTNLQHYPIRS